MHGSKQIAAFRWPKCTAALYISELVSCYQMHTLYGVLNKRSQVKIHDIVSFIRRQIHVADLDVHSSAYYMMVLTTQHDNFYIYNMTELIDIVILLHIRPFINYAINKSIMATLAYCNTLYLVLLCDKSVSQITHMKYFGASPCLQGCHL